MNYTLKAEASAINSFLGLDDLITEEETKIPEAPNFILVATSSFE